MAQIPTISFLDSARLMADPTAMGQPLATPLENYRTTPVDQTGSHDFVSLINKGIDSVQADWHNAQSSMRSIAEGQPVNLHQLMMKMEESRISFQLFLQVRNRLLESYQDVMRMQV